MRPVAGVAEARHPVVRVIHRVIDAIWAVESNPTRRNPQVMIEAGEIGATAEIAHGQGGRVAAVRAQPHVVDRARPGGIRNDPARTTLHGLSTRGDADAES